MTPNAQIGEKAIVTIAKPPARWPADLREIMGSIRIASDLERVGDLGKNTAKRVIAVAEHRHPAQAGARSRASGRACAGPAQGSARRLRLPLAGEGQQHPRARRGDRRDVHLAVPRAADLHDGRSAQHHAAARIFSSAPRTSSASATTPPTSPRRSTTWRRARSRKASVRRTTIRRRRRRGHVKD